MSGKKSSAMSVIFGRLLFIGFSVQILLGLIRIGAGMNYVQLFGDSAFNVKLSGQLALDEYSGVLYPAVLVVIRAVTSLLPIPWYSVMYVLQVGLSVFAGYYLLRCLGIFGEKKLLCLWGALVFATFPTVLQSEVAILPNSFTLSFLMLELAFTKKAWDFLGKAVQWKKSGNAEGRKLSAMGMVFAGDIAKISIFWLLSALNEWEFLYIAAIPIAVILIRDICFIASMRKVSWMYPVLVVLAFLTLIVGVNNFTQEKGLYDKPEKSFATMLFDRTAWKAVIYRQSSWPADMTEMVGTDVMTETMYYQGNVKKLLEPAIEEKVGTKAAQEYYLYVAESVIKYNTSELLHDMAIDFAGYFITPVMTRMLLNQTTYVSYTSRNFDILKRNCPVLTKYYLDYSLLWFEIALIICAVELLYGFIGRKKNAENSAEKIAAPESKKSRFWIFTIVFAVVLTVWYMMQGSGVFDYKQGQLTTVLWLAAMFLFVRNKDSL